METMDSLVWARAPLPCVLIASGVSLPPGARMLPGLGVCPVTTCRCFCLLSPLCIFRLCMHHLGTCPSASPWNSCDHSH